MAWQVRVDLQDGVGWRDISSITRDGMERTRVLHNKLKPTQDKLTFTTELSQVIANTMLANPERLVLVEVLKDAVLWFKGYASPLTNVEVSNGDNTIDWNVLDNSWRLKAAVGTTVGYTGLKVCDPADKPYSLVHQLLYAAGYADADIAITATIPSIVSSLIGIQDEITYWELLSDLLYDHGHVFFHGPDGRFDIYNWNPDTIVTGGAVSNATFIDRISIKTSDEDSDAVRVDYFAEQTALNRFVFESQTLEAGAPPPSLIPVFDGAAYFSDSVLTSNGRQIVATFNHRVKALFGFEVNTLFAGRVSFWADAGYVPLTPSGVGNGFLETFTPHLNCADVLFTLPAAFALIVWRIRFRIYCDCVYRTSQNTVKESAGDSINRVKVHKATLALSPTDADRLAKGILNWLELSRIQYAFKQEAPLALGGCVDLTQPETGIATKARVVEAREKVTEPFVSYKAEGVADLGVLSGITDEQIWTVPPSEAEVAGSSGQVQEGLEITQPIRGPALPGSTEWAPVKSGLYMSRDFLGFFKTDVDFDPETETVPTSGVWKVYIKSDGTFSFEGDAGNRIVWDGATLKVFGDLFLSGASRLKGKILTGDDVQSENFVPDTEGWRIQGGGNAEFQNVKVRGELHATSTTTVQGKVVEGPLQSNNYALRSAGWKLGEDGVAEFNGVFRGPLVAVSGDVMLAVGARHLVLAGADLSLPATPLQGDWLHVLAQAACRVVQSDAEHVLSHRLSLYTTKGTAGYLRLLPGDSVRLMYRGAGFAPQAPAKIADPAVLPPSSVSGVAWSPNGRYLAAATILTPFITVYDWTTGSPVKIADPAALPASAGRGVAWSPDGRYLAVVHLTTPFVTIYDWTTGSPVKIADPAVLPTGNSFAAAWSPDGRYLAIARATTPFVTVYDWITGSPVKIADPAALPAGQGDGAAWSPDGRYLAIAHATTPFVTVYDWMTGSPVKITNPTTLPAGQGTDAAWSPDGRYLAIAHSVTPFVTIYDWTTGIPVKIANPAVLPSGNALGAAWSADGRLLAIAHDTSRYVTIYLRNAQRIEKIPDPAILPSSAGNGPSGWSPDGRYLVVPHTLTPFLTIYDWRQTAAKEWVVEADIAGVLEHRFR